MTQEQLIKELVKTLEDCGLLITALHSIFNWADQLPPKLQGPAHTRKEAIEAIAELDYERREAIRKANNFLSQ
jgi:sugar phosphate isomerase/epimerase